MTSSVLAGTSVLIVEDDYFIMDDMRRNFEGSGARVIGPVATVAEALAMVEGGTQVDAAVLDINLKGQKVFPLADLLTQRGIPFVFATGYDESIIPERHRGGVRCEKPVRPEVVADALAAVVQRSA